MSEWRFEMVTFHLLVRIITSCVTLLSACITYVHNEDIYHVYTMPLQGCICLLMTFSIFYFIVVHYIAVLKTYLFFSLKACKQFVKSDENVSPILTKTDRHSGLYLYAILIRVEKYMYFIHLAHFFGLV